MEVMGLLVNEKKSVGLFEMGGFICDGLKIEIVVFGPSNLSSCQVVNMPGHISVKNVTELTEETYMKDFKLLSCLTVSFFPSVGHWKVTTHFNDAIAN